ncbi:MAG: hypothetical protein EHM93_02940 [Bacteroidales bacterium]|nr:MAG: hypothetical protein EHM93_02940 [Bacteroidales bacterium]
MIRIHFLVLSGALFLSGSIKSQERRDIGLQAGGSYYMGDYNQGTPMYQPSPSFGLLFRYNLNKYYSLRLSASYNGLKGNYTSSNFYLPGVTGSFSKQLIEAEGLCEMNFMSFNTKCLNKDNFTPYVIFGFGAAYVGGEIIPHLPFGVGVKYCPLPRITIGWEWRLSKTFSDNIDNYNNVYDGSKAIFHNNDWFSFVGLFVTFRLYKNNTCPVYE